MDERWGLEVAFAADVRTWTGELTEQLEIRPRHDDVVVRLRTARSRVRSWA